MKDGSAARRSAHHVDAKGPAARDVHYPEGLKVTEREAGRRPFIEANGGRRAARRKEGDEVQQSIVRVDEGRECRRLQTRVFEEDRGLLVGQLTDLGFQPGREGDDVGALSRGFLPKRLQFWGLLANLVLPDVGD